MDAGKFALIVFAALCLAPVSAISQQRDVKELSAAAEAEWVGITGSVVSSVGDSFVLDYGGGNVTVEMDDYDWYDENALIAGDRVTVTGRMDDDFYTTRTIEASSVYVDKLNTYYYASAADEESGYYSYPAARYARDDEWIGVTGTVISQKEGTVMLDTGPRVMKVDTGSLEYKPKLDVGERVTVFGEMDDSDLFEGRELLASSVITLSEG